MPILAVIDVEDDGSLKIQNFRDQVEGLNLTLRKSREEGERQKQSTSQQRDALDRLTDDVRKNHTETLRQVQGLRLVSSEMRAGGIATKERIAALQQLAAMTAQGTLLNAQQRMSLTSVAQAMQAGQTISKQQAAAIQSAAQAAENAVRSNGSLANSFGNLQSQAMALAQALGAAGLGYALKNYLTESFQIAARNEVLSTSMSVVAKNSHRSAIEMEVQVQKIRALGITTKESRDAVLDFAQANMKLADAAKLARIAQDLAVVGGMNSSEAFNRLTRAIQIQQPLLLRQFGIVTGLDEIYTKYARTVNKSVRELDAYDKRMAFLNRIVEEGTKVAGAYELSMNDVGKMMGSTARLVEELQNKVGQALLPVIKDLVVLQHEALKTLGGLSPATMKWVTAILAGAAAMTALTAAAAGFKALGIWAVITSLSPVVLGVAAAVGVLTAAWIVLRGEMTYDVKAASQQVAQLRMQKEEVLTLRKAVDDKAKALEEARKKGEGAAKAQEDLNKALIKLNGVVPGAVKSMEELTQRFSVEEAKIKEVIEGYDKLIAKRAEATGQSLDAATKEKDALLLAYNEVVAALDSGKPVARLSQLSRQTMAVIQQNTSSWSRFTGSLNKDLSGALGQFLTNAEARLKQLGGTIAELQIGLRDQRGDGTEERLAGLRGTIAEIAGGEAKLREYLGRMKVSWADFQKAQDERLREIEQGVRGFVEESEKNAAKWQQSYDRTFKSITQTAETTGADFAAVRAALRGVATGTDEYATRLLRAKGVLESLEKSTPALRKQFKDLEADVEALKATQLEQVFRQWSDKASEAAQAIEQVLAEDRARSALEMAERVLQSDRKLSDERIQMARQTDELERDLMDRRLDASLTATERALTANNRYYEDKRRALQDEIRQRQAAMAEEFRQLELTKAARDRELAQTIERAKQRFRVELETATAIEKSKQALASGRSADQIEDDIRNIKKQYDEFLDAQRAAQQQHNDALYDQERASLVRRQEALQEYVVRSEQLMGVMVDDNRATNAQILKEHSYTFRMAAEYAAGFVSQVTKGLADILTGARSFKDVFIGIWQSIKAAVGRIMNDIVQASVNGLLGIGTAQGGRAGVMQAMGGLFGFARGGAALNGGGSLGAVAGGAPWAVTPYAGGGLAGAPAWLGPLAAAAGGGVMGFGLGRLMSNRWAAGGVGALGGAATGAAIGTFLMPGVGTLLGGLIGGGAGLLGGLLGRRGVHKQTQQTRDAWFDQAGGIDNLIKLAEKYNVSLDKVMSARRPKELERAVKDWEKAIQEAEKAAELKKAKEGLAKTKAQFDALRKSAQLVGYDIQKMYDTKTLEEFNEEQQKLNDLLEQQRFRMEGLSQASGGFAARVEGTVARFARTMTDLTKAMSPERIRALEEAFRKAQEGGFEGGMAKFLLSDAGKGLLTPEEMERLKKAIADAQVEFGRLGDYASAIFANVMRETGDVIAAIEAIGPALDQMIAMQNELGIKASGSLEKLLTLRKAITENADIAQNLTGLAAMIEGLGKAGALSADLMNTFGADAAAQWEELKARGVDTNTALLMMQPTLQALYEAQKRYGITVDETTQKLIDMGVESGMVGDNFMDVNERIFDVLLLIAETLGADIPEGFRKAREAAERAGEQTEAGVGGGNDELERQREVLDRVKNDWGIYSDSVVADIERINRAAASVTPPGPPSSPGGSAGTGGAGATAPTRGMVVIGGGTVEVALVADGRTLAKTTVPYIPEIARANGIQRR